MSDYINTSLQPPSGARMSWDAMDDPAESSFAAPSGSTATMCQSCHKQPATPDHTCPYKEDINNDSETMCNCCDACRRECCMDI